MGKDNHIKIRANDKKKEQVRRNAKRYGFPSMSAMLMYCYEEFLVTKRIERERRKWETERKAS